MRQKGWAKEEAVEVEIRVCFENVARFCIIIIDIVIALIVTSLSLQQCCLNAFGMTHVRHERSKASEREREPKKSASQNKEWVDAHM